MHSQNRDFNDESFWPEILVFALDVALGVWRSLPAVGRTMSVDEVMQRVRDVCEQCSPHSMKLGCVSRRACRADRATGWRGCLANVGFGKHVKHYCQIGTLYFLCARTTP